MIKRLFFLFLLFQSSLFVMAQEDEFVLPMRFGIVGDGVDLLPLELDYDLEAQSSLRIGDAWINSETVQVFLGPILDYSPDLAPYLTVEDKAQSVLLLKWPTELITEGQLEAVGRSGQVLWTSYLKASQIADWKAHLRSIRGRMKDTIHRDDDENAPLFGTTLIVKDFLRSAKSLLNANEGFRLCLSQINDDGQVRICAPYTSISKVSRKWNIQKDPEPEQPARVILAQQQVPLKGRRRVTGKIVQFLAELSNGYIYEFVSRPPKIQIMELTKNDRDTAKVVGFDQVPAAEYRILNPTQSTFLVRFLKWEETIGDLRQFWEAKISLKEPVMYFRGPGGGLFKQGFEIRRLPREEIRPFLHGKTPDSTYVNGPWLHGVRAKNTTITEGESSVVSSPGSEEFDWSFQATNRGDLNRSHVVVKDGDETFKAYYEMYKGFPRELSGRTSIALASSGKVLYQMEGAFNYWLEDLLGWTNYWVSRQRWGVSAKYFQSLNQLTLVSKGNSSFSESDIFHMWTLDLKYRLTPGLWNRDETWGLQLNYNDIRYGEFHPMLAGVGMFWARSMPRLFEDWFNLFSFIRYPKWV
ncbi:MAG: hypothetical protein C5B49_00900, partial [Bdellovibrio sp.]